MERYPLVPKCRVLKSRDTECFPEVSEKEHLVFFNEKGMIRAGCCFGENDLFTFDLGIVPRKVADCGPDTVLRWSGKRMHHLIARERRRLDDQDRKTNGVLRESDAVHQQLCRHGKQPIHPALAGLPRSRRDEEE